MNSQIVKSCFMNPRKKSERSDDKNFIADCGTCKKTLSGNINNTSNFLKHIKVQGHPFESLAMATGGDNSIMKQLDDIIECAICTERFADPRSLPCIHSFCLKCFEGFARDKQAGAKMPCPTCRKEFTIPDGGVSELPKNFFITKLMQIKLSAGGSTPSLCDACQPDDALNVVKKSAAVYCVECQEKYCEDCAKNHKTFKISKSHKQVKLDECGELCHEQEILCKSFITRCEKHPDQALSVYCRDCKSTMCMICYFASHKQHDCSDINDIVDKFRSLMLTDISSLGDVAVVLREMLTSIEQQKQTFSETVGETEKEICEEAELKKQLIERNKQILLDELTTKQRHVVKRFDNLCHEITQHLSLVDNLKKYIDELSRKGAGADITQEMNVVHNRVEELLKLDVMEQSRDDMNSTEVKFTASTILTDDCINAVGKIDVTITARVKKEKPIIVMTLDKVEATAKDNVRLVSTVTGEPEPSVEWFKDNVKLTSSTRITMERNGNEYSLVVKQVGKQDEGHYAVRSTNSEGLTQAVATLTVKVAMPTVPTLIHTIHQGKKGSVAGVTSLNNQLFVVYKSAEQQVEVYDTATFTLQRNISVPGLTNTLGAALTSCAVNNCLYVAECSSNLVFRVSLESNNDTVTQWSVGIHPGGISVNSANNVLVTCNNDNKIQEYTTHGSLIRDISLSSGGISYPRHSIQLPSGLIAISYNEGVCVVDNNGAVIHNYNNTSGASIQFNIAWGLASVQNGCTLVANYGAHQILLLNPSFSSTRILSLPSNSSLQHPAALFLDESRGRLYVGEWYGSGLRVLVFDNVFNVGSDFQ